MSNEPETHAPPPPPPRPGCLQRLMGSILFLSAAGLAVALYFVSRPQDLSAVGGYGEEAPASARDMRALLRNSLDRGFPVTLTEQELNAWLRASLEARQGGLLGGRMVEIQGVWVRLHEGYGELIVEREAFGHPLTVSTFFSVETITEGNRRDHQWGFHGGSYHENLPHPKRGGRFGQLVVPQGFQLLVRPSLRNLHQAYEAEIVLAFAEMERIRFEAGRLILEPRSSGDSGLFPE